jgi:SAM-dependent methyltransferase
MGSSGDGNVFAGSMPQVYEKYLVPLIFEPYAADLVTRLVPRSPTRVLEVAAGTGVVTRAMAAALPERAAIVATDLSQPMLDQAAAAGTKRAVEWRQADAMQLPFPDGSFDAVVCQFGAMFFPERGQAFAEARRVLRPGGVFLFNVWDRLEDNEFADCVTAGVAAAFPTDPPNFLPRTPYAYHDHTKIAHDLARGGFTASPEIVTVTSRSRAKSAQDAALGYCQGTPLRAEIETRDAARLADATAAAANVIARRFGDGPVNGKIQANVVAIER